MHDASDSYRNEPQKHDWTEEGGNARGAARLRGEQRDQDDHRQRNDIWVEMRRNDL